MSTIANQLDTLVVTTRTMRTVRYAAYPFNSFTEFAGKYLAAGPDGVFQLDVGTTDNGAPVDAYIETGDMDFGSEMQKRVSDCYVGMRSAGPIALDVTVDSTLVGSYTVDPLAVAALNQRRSWIGKGAKYLPLAPLPIHQRR